MYFFFFFFFFFAEAAPPHLSLPLSSIMAVWSFYYIDFESDSVVRFTFLKYLFTPHFLYGSYALCQAWSLPILTLYWLFMLPVTLILDCVMCFLVFPIYCLYYLGLIAFTEKTSDERRASFTTEVYLRWTTRTDSTEYVNGQRVWTVKTTTHRSFLCHYVTSNLLFSRHPVLFADPGCFFNGVDQNTVSSYVRDLNNKDPRTVDENFGDWCLSYLP